MVCKSTLSLLLAFTSFSCYIGVVMATAMKRENCGLLVTYIYLDAYAEIDRFRLFCFSLCLFVISMPVNDRYMS